MVPVASVQVGCTDTVAVGAETGNIAALVNGELATDVQVPSVAVTVYAVPTVIPEITPPVPTTTVPAGLNV